MAKIGLRNFLYSKLDENDNVTEPKSLGKAVSCKVAIEKYEAELYADDGIAESDYSFKKGTITLEVDDDGDEVFADILGHKISVAEGSSGELVRSSNDTAPYVAVGRILTKVVKGVKTYKVEFLHKVKFKEPDAEEATKGDSIEFKTCTVEGTITALANGEWSKAKTFGSFETADAYLRGLLTKSTT